MLVEIEVLYRATVVPEGRRKEMDCLLSTVVPIRLETAEPPVAIVLDGRPDEAGRSRRSTWYDHGGHLMGEFSEVRDVALGYGAGISPNLSRGPELLSRLSNHRQLPVAIPKGYGERMGRYSSVGDDSPFLTMGAMGRGPNTPPLEEGVSVSGGGVLLAVLPEDGAYRSVRQAHDASREVAIAHAQRRARDMVLHSGTGELLLPSAGPVVQAHSRLPVIVSNQSRRFPSPQSWQGEHLDEALAFHAERYRGLPVLLPKETLQVFRSGLSTWDAAASSLATTAAQFGMCPDDRYDEAARLRAMGVSRTFMSRNDPDVVALQSVVSTPERRALRRRFLTTRVPSEAALAVSCSVLDEVIEAQGRFSLADWPDQDPNVDPSVMWALEHLRQRSAHVYERVRTPAQPEVPGIGAPAPSI